MKLPAAHAAVVSREKVADYLLNAAHPDNGGKAEFFERHGFQRDDWKTLAAALKHLAINGDVIFTGETAHGKKFVIVGPLPSPGGKLPPVQSIWIVDKCATAARLVTAYPRKA